jgi:hypothetical protein
VIGRPVAYFGLSYALSGGLARDLIRNFRSIVELRQQNPANDDLESICKTLVLTDVKAKILATAIAAKKIELESEVDKFLEKICGLEDNLSEQVALLSVAYGPPDGQTLAPSAQDADEKARWLTTWTKSCLPTSTT